MTELKPAQLSCLEGLAVCRYRHSLLVDALAAITDNDYDTTYKMYEALCTVGYARHSDKQPKWSIIYEITDAGCEYLEYLAAGEAEQ